MRLVYIILLILLIGCTTNAPMKKIEVDSSKMTYINNNPRTDALVIGVGKYKNRIRPLYGVEKDLKNIKKLFKFLNIDSITTLKDDKATLSDVRKAFNKYIKSDKNRFGNIFIFYYSGHGVQVVDENRDEKDKKDEATALYDIAINNKGLITEGILLDDELHSILNQIKSKKVLIFDKCHSGSSHRGYNPYIKAVIGEYNLSSKFLENINSNIKSKSKIKNFVLFSATKDDQEAEDSPIGGLFTNSFIDGILYKKADINNDNRITVAELEKFCTTNISNLAVNISKKHIGINLKGNFDPYFAPIKARNKTISSIFNINSLDSTIQRKPLLEDTLDNLVTYDKLKLTLLGGKTRFREHDRIRLEITSSISGYLNIFIAYKDSYRLFMKNQKIKGGKLYAFPNDFMVGKHLVAKRPFGITKIYTLLSRKPLSIKGYLSKRENDLDLTNYLRKGVMVVAKREKEGTKYRNIIENEANILGISKIEFEVIK